MNEKNKVKHTFIFDNSYIMYSENVLAITKLLNILIIARFVTS